MRPALRRRLRAGLLVLALAGVATIATRRFLGVEPAVRAVSHRCATGAEALPVGRPLTLLVWNVQYAASRRHHFFYDGGRAVSVPREDVERTLGEISEAIRAVDPDLVLLQEVDRSSRRTHRIDQHAALVRALRPVCEASAPYHRVGYVPHPDHEHLGRVDMHLGLFSRFRVERAWRRQLPLLRESVVRRWFNLRRALLEAHLPIADGRTLVLMNTHLSAFSRGDGTLARQMAVLAERIDAAEADGSPWILAGDLNALPPGDDPSRLGADAVLYSDAQTPIAPLFERWATDDLRRRFAEEPAGLRTYLPFGATAPDRTLDYVLHAPTIEPLSLEVASQVDPPSDHLPIVLRFTIPPAGDARP